MSPAKRTPLHDTHLRLGARMVPFAGFDMPLQYEGILREHEAVRERVGLFDVSHMGQIHLSGPEAIASAERLLSCPVASLQIGRVRYGMLCNADGGVVDDVTVYRLAEDALFLCVNAANITKDLAWIESHTSQAAGVRDRSDETALIALQGPESASVLGALCGNIAVDLRRFRFAQCDVAGAEVLLSRTGYTGSDGFEIYLASDRAVHVFDALLDAGAAHGLAPAGLGARDTLRLEAALPLYGHELDDVGSPLEAGLDRFVKRERGGFIGAEAIERRAQASPERQLVGFELLDRGVARADHVIASDGVPVGRVTSGAPSPTLGKSIGLGYVPPALAAAGVRFDVQVRGRGLAAQVVKTPFVKAKRKSAKTD